MPARSANRSIAQTQASRTNGRQSQGPTTPQGKHNAAANSRQHGLRATTFQLDNPSDQAHFDTLLAELTFTHQAVTALQLDCCRHIAIALWRRQIIDNLEAKRLQAIAQNTGVDTGTESDNLPSLKTLNRYRTRLARDLKDAHAELQSLQTARTQAFQAKLEKAKEFNQLTHLTAIRTELGDAAFQLFRADVTNEPGNPNRAARRRAEAMARKGC